MVETQEKTYRVLIVDDEPSVCMAYQLMLKYFGHRTQAVSGGAAALNALETEPFDLIITDYLMPGMKGDELAAEVKRRKPEQRIIMATAFGENVRKLGKVNGSADWVLNKPFRIQELRSAIAQVMA